MATPVIIPHNIQGVHCVGYCFSFTFVGYLFFICVMSSSSQLFIFSLLLAKHNQIRVKKAYLLLSYYFKKKRTPNSKTNLWQNLCHFTVTLRRIFFFFFFFFKAATFLTLFCSLFTQFLLAFLLTNFFLKLPSKK